MEEGNKKNKKLKIWWLIDFVISILTILCLPSNGSLFIITSIIFVLTILDKIILIIWAYRINLKRKCKIILIVYAVCFFILYSLLAIGFVFTLNHVWDGMQNGFTG